MNDDDLRRLLHDAASDITPHGTLDDIRSRTKKVDPMTRRWFLPSLAAAAVMALVIGGAFWMTRDDGSDQTGAGPAAGPSGTESASATVVPATVEATVYYVGQGAGGPRLFTEVQRATGTDTPAAAANLAASGTPTDPDYRSYWPKAVTVQSVLLPADPDGRLQVTLSAAAAGRPAGLSPQQATRQVQAVVRTIQDAVSATYASQQAVPPVEFLVGTEVQTDVLGVAGPTYGAGDDADVLAPVQITNVTDGATVPAGKLTVKGLAATFEANVSWEILVGGDAVIDSGFATATEGGVLSPYEFTTNIPLEGPGTYTLVVHDTDESGEGRPVNQDSKEIVVE